MFVSLGGGKRGDEERELRRRNTSLGLQIMLYEVTPSFSSAPNAVLQVTSGRSSKAGV
jgi:hypothetical protein